MGSVVILGDNTSMELSVISYNWDELNEFPEWDDFDLIDSAETEYFSRKKISQAIENVIQEMIAEYKKDELKVIEDFVSRLKLQLFHEG